MVDIVFFCYESKKERICVKLIYLIVVIFNILVNILQVYLNLNIYYYGDSVFRERSLYGFVVLNILKFNKNKILLNKNMNIQCRRCVLLKYVFVRKFIYWKYIILEKRGQGG